MTPYDLVRQHPGDWVFRVVPRGLEYRLVVLCSHHSDREAHALLRAQFPKAALHVLQRTGETYQ